MIRFSDFRLGWRLMRRQPGYSTVMVGSLAIGFAVTFLVLGFLRFESSFDRHVPAIDEVRVLKARARFGLPFWSENVPLSTAASITAADPSAAVTAVVPMTAAVRVDTRTVPLEVTLVDPAFGQVFGVTAAQGELRAALSRPDALVLTPQAAQKLFGTADALGRRVQVGGQSVEVAAIVPVPPEASSVRYEALAGLGSSMWPQADRARALEPWRYYGDEPSEWLTAKVFVRTRTPGPLEALQQRVRGDLEASALRGHLSDKQRAEVGSGALVETRFGPLADSYLDPEARSNSGPKGDRLANAAMLLVAVLILLLTAGNYVNLATIRTVQRQREMAVRKVLGVGARRLVGQMMAESVLVAVVAAVIGAGLAGLLLPAWSDLTGHPIASILGVGDWVAFAAVVAASGVVVGVCAGLYPMWVALKLQTAQALAGRGGTETSGGLWLRRTLTTLQFAIAIFVTGMVVTIAWQIEYLKGIDYGYAVDHLLSAELPKDLTAAQAQSFQEALRHRPEVAAVAGSAFAPVRTELSPPGGRPLVLDELRVGPSYFEATGLKMLAGRALDPRSDVAGTSQVAVIDPVAARRLGYVDPQAAVGRFVDLGHGALRIVGVAQREGSGFRQGPELALVYTLDAAPTQFLVRASHDLPAARAAIDAVAGEMFPDRYVAVTNLRTRLELNAGGPMTILRLCVIVALVIVPLSFFSVYVLSAFTVQKRAREIVVRKLHGATPADVARLLARQFVWLLAIAAIPALPAAWLCGQMFLQQFAEQAGIGAWAALVALVAALTVTLGAALRHTRVAMRMAPADVLRAA